VSRRKKTSVVNSPFGRCGRPDRKRKASAIREVRNQAVKVAVARNGCDCHADNAADANKLIDDAIAEVGAKLH
jgi:hypothetical protein